MVFEGALPVGPHRLTGVLLYGSVDASGRREAQRFEIDFVVEDEDGQVIRAPPSPRWPAR